MRKFSKFASVNLNYVTTHVLQKWLEGLSEKSGVRTDKSCVFASHILFLEEWCKFERAKKMMSVDLGNSLAELWCVFRTNTYVISSSEPKNSRLIARVDISFKPYYRKIILSN